MMPPSRLPAGGGASATLSDTPATSATDPRQLLYAAESHTSSDPGVPLLLPASHGPSGGRTPPSGTTSAAIEAANSHAASLYASSVASGSATPSPPPPPPPGKAQMSNVAVGGSAVSAASLSAAHDSAAVSSVAMHSNARKARLRAALDAMAAAQPVELLAGRYRLLPRQEAGAQAVVAFALDARSWSQQYAIKCAPLPRPFLCH